MIVSMTTYSLFMVNQGLELSRLQATWSWMVKLHFFFVIIVLIQIVSNFFYDYKTLERIG